MNLKHRTEKYSTALFAQRAGQVRGCLYGLCLIIMTSSPLRADPFSYAAASMFGMMGSMANMMAATMSPAGSYYPGFNHQAISPYSMTYGTAYPWNGLAPLDAISLPNQPPLFSNNSALSNQAQSSPGNFWLNGQWRASTGEMLQISGKHFRLISRQGALTGFVTSNADLLSLYVPQIQQTLLFMVKLEANTLMLKEPNGNIQRFQKISP